MIMEMITVGINGIVITIMIMIVIGKEVPYTDSARACSYTVF